MKPELPSKGKERWYYGYRWRERREMTEGERELLAEVRTEAQKRRRSDLMRSSLLIGFGLLIIAISVTNYGREAYPALFWTGLIAAVLGITWVAITDSMTRGTLHDLTLDDQDGSVDEFDLLIPSDSILNFPGGTLVSTGGSHRILLGDTSWYRKVARAMEVAPIRSTEEPCSGNRRLSEVEVAEAQNLKGNTPHFYLYFLGFAFLESLRLVVPKTEDHNSQVILRIGVLLVSAAIMTIPAVGRNRILRAARGCEEVEKRVVQGKDGEVIRGTNVPWTVRGFPAAWRRRPADGFFTVAIDEASWKLG